MKSLGQYFTTNDTLKSKVLEFTLNNPQLILEPSIGQGDLVSLFPNVAFDMYEIDKSIKPLDNIPQNIIYTDFLTTPISKKYTTIIGNPPYIKSKKRNVYIDFIEKCYNLLEPNGELIFIIPSDFFKTTCSCDLINTMVLTGSFTHIYHPHNEKLFKNATVDVLVFRYCKNNLISKNVLYNDIPRYVYNTNGLLSFHKSILVSSKLIKDYFDVYVGFVSGKESVFKNNILGNVDIITGKNKTDKYILLENPSNNTQINEFLESHKQSLISRKIRKFNDTNWFEWGALRNIKSIQSHIGKDCIYIHNITRNTEIAFLGKINYFNGNLLMLKPKENIDLQKVVDYFNSYDFQENFIFSGRIKIGHRQLSNSFF